MPVWIFLRALIQLASMESFFNIALLFRLRRFSEEKRGILRAITVSD